MNYNIETGAIESIISLPLCNRVINCDICEDVNIPEGLPDVRRVLAVKENILSPAKFIGARAVDMSGSVDYSVVYLGADGNIYSTPFSAEYSFSLPLDNTDMLDANEGVSVVCSLSADGFATSGVHILNSLGIKNISFGSECADKQLLEAAANAISSSEFIQAYQTAQKNTAKGSTRTFFDTLGEVMGKDISLLSNDILAISYIAAIERLGCDMNVIPIKREGLAYNDTALLGGKLPSASAIRETIRSGDGIDGSLISAAIPEQTMSVLKEAINSGTAPVTAQNIGREILSFFKTMSANEIISRAISRSASGAYIGNDGCGICERLCNSARQALDFDEFMTGAYNAKYTDARINRLILFSLFGVSDKLAHSLPEYTVLLAANLSGRDFLSDIRKNCDLPIVTKSADAPDSVLTSLVRSSDSLYSSAMPSSHDQDCFVKKHPFMLN
jgi:predicted nucleotidyltransferase